MKYINRLLEKKLKAYIKQFPVILLTGPRQAGKSTLLKYLFGEKKTWRYITLDERGTLARIQSDTDLFVNDINSNIIIDEAQKAPDLFHSIKYFVDKETPYKIILSGSANFHLFSKVTETLAGRAGILELYPFSTDEILRGSKKNGIIDKIFSSSNIKTFLKDVNIAHLKTNTIMNYILFGGYPKIHEFKIKAQKITWLENYRTTYIERDLRDLTQVADINVFQRFYQILAFQIGNLLNLSNIAGELGVSVTTCRKYLHILETSYQYFILNPFHVNLKKRLVKTPKIYIADTGISNFFMGNDTIEMMMYSGKFGEIFENFIISEFVKYNTVRSRKYKLYFWRTSNGAEVDLIIEKGMQLIPIEIKSSVKISTNSIRGLMKFLSLDIGKKIPFGIIFYRGTEIYRIKGNIIAIPISLI